MSVSRLSLPSEFHDKVSAKLLMPPEPQYFWANLLYNAIAEAQFRKVSALGPNAQRMFSGAGAPVPDLMQMDPNMGRDPIRAEVFGIEDMQAGPGHTVRIPRMVFADTTYTMASRRVTRETIGTTPVNISGEMVSITIERVGGPLTAASGSVGPHVIEEFDLNRADHNLIERIGVHLARDRMKFNDGVVADLAVNGAATTAYIYPGDPNNALTTDNSAFLTQNDRALDVEAVLRAAEMAKNNKIPPFANGKWVLVLSPRQERQLVTSAGYQRLAKYTPEKNPLFANYVGTIGPVDIFVSQTNPTTTANSTITVQLGVLMGPGALAYAMGKPAGPAVADDTNYGTRVSVIWLADEGYERLDNRFLISVRSD